MRQILSALRVALTSARLFRDSVADGFDLTRLGVLLLVIAGVTAPRAGLASDPALIAAAKKEGALVVYGCDPPQTPIYLDAFKKKYPEIKVSSYIAGCWQLYNRNENERKAKAQAADVFFALEDVLSRMQKENLLERYASPELEHFPAYAKPEGKAYVRVKTLILGIASNPSYLKGVEPPRDWPDFANPRDDWRNQITYYDPRTSSAAFTLLATLHQNLGEARTAEIYRGLVKSGAELTPTTPAGVAKLLSGEKPLMFYIVNNHYSGAVAKGAPVQFIVPTSGTVAMPFSVALLKDAPHSAAARLFIDFMMSEVQGIVQKANEYPLRTGVATPQGMPDLSKVKLMPVDIDKALEQQAQLIKFWQDTTGIR
ncbi:MAG: ABC transporter substrate-binding protein [Lautropia sp.]